MSKKHYIALANTIKGMQPIPLTAWQIEQLATFCADQNPRFNRERWLDYIAGKCGPNGGAIK